MSKRKMNSAAVAVVVTNEEESDSVTNTLEPELTTTTIVIEDDIPMTVTLEDNTANPEKPDSVEFSGKFTSRLDDDDDDDEMLTVFDLDKKVFSEVADAIVKGAERISDAMDDDIFHVCAMVHMKIGEDERWCDLDIDEPFENKRLESQLDDVLECMVNDELCGLELEDVPTKIQFIVEYECDIDDDE